MPTIEKRFSRDIEMKLRMLKVSAVSVLRICCGTLRQIRTRMATHEGLNASKPSLEIVDFPRVPAPGRRHKGLPSKLGDGCGRESVTRSKGPPNFRLRADSRIQSTRSMRCINLLRTGRPSTASPPPPRPRKPNSRAQIPSRIPHHPRQSRRSADPHPGQSSRHTRP